ncbi:MULTISPECIES: hypothetical protein [Halorussus]|uniref:hypothetical protein n=1 Tax=Halorussus TaxID=1070314 RepID=UPI000E21032B|nr:MULTISPECIES: hypothetical protein [Halorussus]NHN58098.1 hypothetical protein [Halorussus sp. JP-T4]
MDPTWVIAAAVPLVGAGYVFARRARRSRVVCWTLLGASLFALATRDLFRSREQARPVASPVDEQPDRSTDRPRTDSDDPRRTPLFARLRRRVAGWLN